MRCLTKAAVLLSTTLTSAFVIPDSAGLTTLPTNAVVEYLPSEALLKFVINTAEPKEGYRTLTFQVESTNKACGESNVLLNGQRLDTEWDGTTAHGREYLDIYGGKEAEWHVSCLYDVTPADGSNSDGGDVVHVLSLQVFDEPTRPGFTISYKQLDTPAILRFRPRYNPIDFAILPILANRWRNPSIEFDPDVLVKTHKQKLATPFESLGHVQKSLGAKLSAFKSSLKKEIKKLGLCPKKPGQPKKLEDISGWASHEIPAIPDIPSIPTISKTPEIPSIPKVSSDKLLEPPPSSHDEVAHDVMTSTTETTDTTNTVPNHSAATTRSLTASQALDTTSASISTFAPVSQPHNNLQHLKIFGLILVFSSCLAWLFLHCRDPRRRAECLARREERRNKKLYRRAAREYKVKKWFWNFRLRYGLAPAEVVSYNEKRTRVTTQEEILEDVMSNDIRALRNAHRVVSSITAAEEGRSGLVYESTDSERRRSVSPLPGYESEGSQPPMYDDVRGSLEGQAIVDGFRYTPAEFTEFTSNSSVISTSPRVSRDGTNSDFDEKFEPISLAGGEPAGLAH